MDQETMERQFIADVSDRISLLAPEEKSMLSEFLTTPPAQVILKVLGEDFVNMLPLDQLSSNDQTDMAMTDSQLPQAEPVQTAPAPVSAQPVQPTPATVYKGGLMIKKK
tara:strand:+ start:213 stop:539 length:327 start_codon:yes stop_codon:yes gene_type:complete